MEEGPEEINNFLARPRPESCVDEEASGAEHMMVALLDVFKRRDVKAELSRFKEMMQTGRSLTMNATTLSKRQGCFSLNAPFAARRRSNLTYTLTSPSHAPR